MDKILKISHIRIYIYMSFPQSPFLCCYINFLKNTHPDPVSCQAAVTPRPAWAWAAQPRTDHWAQPRQRRTGGGRPLRFSACRFRRSLSETVQCSESFILRDWHCVWICKIWALQCLPMPIFAIDCELSPELSLIAFFCFPQLDRVQGSSSLPAAVSDHF